MNYTSVYYNDTNGNRVVKGPLGIVETYKFTNLQGVPKVIEIDRAANSPVVAATETFAYDSNGYRSRGMSRCLLKFLKRSLRIEIYAASAI